MSVIVKGMDLPLGCCYEEYEKWYGHTEYCPFCNHDDVPYCILEPNNMVDEELLFIGIDSRPDWCPLIEIPKEARLIDKRIVKEKMIPLDFSVQKWISEVDLDLYVPTVFEEEEK